MATLSISIIADAARARKALTDTGDDLGKFADKADRSSSSFGSSMAGIGKAALAVGAIATTGFVALAAGAWSAAEESAKIGRETERVIKSTGAAAWISAGQAGDLADSLSEIQGVDDEVVQGVENLLFTFTNVQDVVGEGNDVFSQATGLASDMAAVLGTDASGAAIQLGKALNDPTKGITALSKAGVSFTEDQKDQIKVLQESGDTLGAQKIILGELSKEFGGAAAAAATPLDRLKIMVGNAQEAFGAFLIPIVASAAAWLGEKLPAAIAFVQPIFQEIVGGIQAFAGAFSAADGDVTSSGFPGFLERAANVLTGTIIPALGKLASWIKDDVLPVLSTFASWLVDKVGLGLAKLGEWLTVTVVPALQSFAGFVTTSVIPAVKTFGEFLDSTVVPALVSLGDFLLAHKENFIGFALVVGALLVPAFVAWAFSAGSAAVATIAATWPILAVAAGIMALVSAVIYAYQNWDFFRNAVDAVAQGLLWFWNSALKPVIDFISANAIPVIMVFADIMITSFTLVWNVLGPIVGFILELIVSIATKLGEVIGWVFDHVENLLQIWWSIFNVLKDVASQVFSVFTTIVETVVGFVQRVFAVGQGIWNFLTDGVISAKDTIFGALGELIGFVAGLGGKIWSAAAGMWDGILGAFKAVINFVIRGWNALAFKIPGFDLGPIHFDGFRLGMPTIPELAGGGIVYGPTLALIGERGPEAVVPLGRMGGNTYITVNVPPSTGLGPDSPQIARDIVTALENWSRRNGPVDIRTA